jgi:S1-C subfamily serine protease
MAVRLAPSSPEARNDRGWVRERAGQTELALDDYAAALALRPGYARAETNHRRLLARLQPEARTTPPPTTPAEPMPPSAPSVTPPSVVTLPAQPETVPIPNPLPPSLTGTFTTGSGVVLGDGRWVVTNHHVVAGSRSVVLRNGAGHLLRAQVVAIAPADDLALLRVETSFPGAPAVQLSALAEPRAGRQIVVLGFPKIGMFGGARPTVVAGMVAKADGLHDDQATFQTTARIRPGNSGGPIFDLNGRLLGVMSARLLWQQGGKDLRDDDTVPMSVGVKSSRILRLMQAAQLAGAPETTMFTAEELYRLVQDSIVLVAAYP